MAFQFFKSRAKLVAQVVKHVTVYPRFKLFRSYLKIIF